MTGGQHDPDGPPVEFEHRSTLWACSRCGCLVHGDDREQHRRHHAALDRTLSEATGRSFGR